MLFGSFDSRQSLCAWAAVAVPALTALTLYLRGRWRIVAGTGVATCLIAIPASETRIGLVAAVVGFLTVAGLVSVTRVQRPEASQTIAGLLALAALGVGMYGVSTSNDEGRSDRLGAIFSPTQDLSYQRRQLKWRQVIAKVNERPFAGYGLGSAGDVGRRSRFVSIDDFYIDNGYLQLAYQQGWPAIPLLVAALAALAAGLVASLFRAPPGVAELRIAAVGALAAWVTLVTASNFYSTGSTILLGILIGLAVMPADRLVDKDGEVRLV